MTTHSSPADDFSSPEAFFADVDLSKMPGWSTADDLATLSVSAFIAQREIPVPSPSQALVRMYGPAVEGHSVPVRTTVRALSALQDTLSAVAAAMHGQPARLRGRLPEFARAATELRLVAQPAAGSVILTLATIEPPDTDRTGQSAMFRTPSLADESMHRMLEIVRLAEASTLNHDDALLDDLRPLGPRVARQLVKLAETVLDDDLLLDLTWREHGREPDHASVRRSTASIIKDTITSARVDVELVTLTGLLQTVSTVRDLDLLLDNGDRIVLEATDELRADLGPLYERRVQANAEVTVRTSGTGQERARYHLISVSPLEDD